MGKHRHRNKTEIKRTKNTSHYKKVTSVTDTAFISVTTDNKESEANQKFLKASNILIAMRDANFVRTFAMRTPDFDYTKSGIPSYKYMTNVQRTSLLKIIIDYGNTNSRIVARSVGLSARQIGQIRRWHIGDWRIRKVKF